jgi:hypothetical protein
MRPEALARWWRSLGYALGIALALALVLGPYRFHARMAQRLAAAEAAQTALEKEAAALAEAARAQTQWAPAVVALARQGLLGPPARLSWIEALKAAGPALALRDLQWSFGPLAAATVPDLMPVAGFAVVAAPVSLRFGAPDLAAVGDLLRWLERHAGGVFTVGACHLQRLDMKAPGNIEARCESQWLTVQPAAEQGQPP